MRKEVLSYFLSTLAVVCGGACVVSPAGVSNSRPRLKLIQTIHLNDIRADEPDLTAEQLAKEVQTSRMVNAANHFDHLEVDLKRHRIFITPEDHKSVEVYDFHTGAFVYSVRGIGMAHAVLYRPDVDEVFVTDGADGALRIFSGKDYHLIKTVKLLTDADSIGYDPATHYLYIDNGGLDAHLNYCLLSIVDTNTGQHVGDIRIDSNRIEAMALAKAGPRIFLNMTGKNEIGVIDREKRTVSAKWPVIGGHVNVAIALDERHHRLFVACRDGHLIVLNSDTGKVVRTFPIATGVDDMTYDPASQRLYVACGEGFVDVYEQQTADQYRLLGAIPTGPLGKTGLLVPELNRYFVAIPPHGKASAEVLVFEVQ